jgi:hypothetical protein
MKRVFLMAAVAAGVLLAGCGSSGHHPAATAASSPPASPPADLATSCKLGFDDGGTLLALKSANESHPRAEQVTFVNNSSNGVPIDSFATTVSYQGLAVTDKLASAFAPNIPFFLIPNQTYSAVIDLSHFGKVIGSDSTYLHSTCSIASFN